MCRLVFYHRQGISLQSKFPLPPLLAYTWLLKTSWLLDAITTSDCGMEEIGLAGYQKSRERVVWAGFKNQLADHLAHLLPQSISSSPALTLPKHFSGLFNLPLAEMQIRSF